MTHRHTIKGTNVKSAAKRIIYQPVNLDLRGFCDPRKSDYAELTIIFLTPKVSIQLRVDVFPSPVS